MGMDMRYAFQKENPPGQWRDVSSNFSGWRSYELFAWLGCESANSRCINPVLPIAALRGLPRDIEWEDYDLYGEHSYSYLTADEILNAPVPEEPGEVLIEFINTVKQLQKEHGRIRIIFGFES
ncbi:hypothetical protein ACE3J3_21260 [Enterobacter hormaechei subsp. steigerwaltii]